jgi:hypothetical protein
MSVRGDSWQFDRQLNVVGRIVVSLHCTVDASLL